MFSISLHITTEVALCCLKAFEPSMVKSIQVTVFKKLQFTNFSPTVTPPPQSPGSKVTILQEILIRKKYIGQHSYVTRNCILQSPFVLYDYGKEGNIAVLGLSLYSVAEVMQVCTWLLMSIYEESRKWDAGFCIYTPVAQQPIPLFSLMYEVPYPFIPLQFNNLIAQQNCLKILIMINKKFKTSYLHKIYNFSKYIINLQIASALDFLL